MELHDRVTIVTGAAGALGSATAKVLMQAGAKVALLDISEEALRAVYGDSDERMQLVPVDLRNRSALVPAVDAIVARFGRIDALCNVAGGFRMGHTVHETPEDVWRQMLDLNMGSVLNTSAASVPHMLKRGRGSIVNIGAVAGLKSPAEMAAYSVSKSAVMRLTESMAAELGPQGIRVNCVLPSIMDTPTNRADMPDVDPKNWVSTYAVANVIAFLVSDEASGVSGAAIPVEGSQ